MSSGEGNEIASANCASYGNWGGLLKQLVVVVLS